MCLERTVRYLALFVVSGYFMKYWTWRCKKFSCMSQKHFSPSTVCANLFSVTEHPLLRAVLKLRTCRVPGVHPWSVQGTSGNGTPGSGVGAKVGITPRWDSMALEDFSNLSQCFCSLLLFLNNVPFFLSTRFFNYYPDLKKFFYFSPPAQRHEVY